MSVTCRVRHLPRPSPATSVTCHVRHLPRPSPAASVTCHVRHLPRPSPATSVTCHVRHLPRPSPATSVTCRVRHRPSPSPTISVTDHLRHLAPPSPCAKSQGPAITQKDHSNAGLFSRSVILIKIMTPLRQKDQPSPSLRSTSPTRGEVKREASCNQAIHETNIDDRPSRIDHRP
jgi:hypothetical protein